MHNAKHTPGPWSCGDSFDVISCRFDEMPIVAKVRPVDSKAEREANARLIVAAPDYFDGCKDLPQISDGESTSDYDKRVLAWFYCSAGKIHAANNKAKGA